MLFSFHFGISLTVFYASLSEVDRLVLQRQALFLSLSFSLFLCFFCHPLSTIHIIYIVLLLLVLPYYYIASILGLHYFSTFLVQAIKPKMHKVNSDASRKIDLKRFFFYYSASSICVRLVRCAVVHIVPFAVFHFQSSMPKTTFACHSFAVEQKDRARRVKMYRDRTENNESKRKYLKTN